MTANQIAYQNMLESKRSNTAKESENTRHNLATEAQAQSALAETIRANKKRESLESEGNVIKWGQLAETNRSNLANEFLKSQQNAETERANKAKESETTRHNMRVESETGRHNLAQEVETGRHNTVQEKQNWAETITEGIRDVSGAANSIANIFKSSGSGLAKSILSLR